MKDVRVRLRGKFASVFLLFLLAGSFVHLCTAQDEGKPAPPPVGTIRVSSRLVVLDVKVFDREGHFVPNLDRSKFVVTEDKAPQTIRNFEAPEDHAMPAAKPGEVLVRSTADIGRIGSAPVNVLVIDELNTPFPQIAHAQQSLRRFLERQPEVLPVPTLFVASGNSRVTVLHDFTQSRDDLIASVKQHVTDADFDAMINQLNGGRTGSQSGFAKTAGALAQIASVLRGIPGHKNVIWVGTGFDNAYDLAAASEMEGNKIRAAIRLVTDRMLDSRMTLSTVDPAGVMTPMVEDANAEAGLVGQDSLTFEGRTVDASFNSLAYSTGGSVVKGRNDLDRVVGMLAGQDAHYYTLSYVPTSGSDERREYRHIRVEMKDPSLHAGTRTGYFSGREAVAEVAPNTAKRQPQQLRFDLLSAARSKLVYTGLHVAAKPAKDGYTVLVNASDLRWEGQGDGTRTAEVSIVGVAFDGKGKELGQRAVELKQEIGGTDRIDGGVPVGFGFVFVPPAGTARVRVVVRDAVTGNLGSADVTP